jgi:hypothetical protein
MMLHALWREVEVPVIIQHYLFLCFVQKITRETPHVEMTALTMMEAEYQISFNLQATTPFPIAQQPLQYF